MRISMFLLIFLTLLACSETPERDEPVTGAYIVSIDPPILDEGQPDDDQINIGELRTDGWQPITITFSERPDDLWINLNDGLASQWVLIGPVLTIKTFCDSRWYPGRTFTYVVSWDAGFIKLNYKCPD